MEDIFLRTIYGVIVLGAFGSILAIFLIRFFKYLIKKIFSKERQIGIIGLVLRPIAESRLQTYVLLNKNDHSSYNCYLVDKFSSYIITTMLLFFSLFLLIIYLLLNGFQTTFYLVAIISFIFLALKWWWKSVLKGIGIVMETYGKNNDIVKNMLKKIDTKSSAFLAINGIDEIVEKHKKQ